MLKAAGRARATIEGMSTESHNERRAGGSAPADSAPASPLAAEASAAGLISCATCQACCCRLEVMLMGDDDVPPALTAQDRWGGWVMRRLDDGWCAALDRSTLLCTIYERRPFICREFQVGEYECLEERAPLAAR